MYNLENDSIMVGYIIYRKWWHEWKNWPTSLNENALL